MVIGLVLLSLVAGLIGFFGLAVSTSLVEAPLPLGLVGIACLFGIFARMAQALELHRASMKK